MSDYLVYIGTYSGGDTDGIHVHRLDMTTGALTPQSSISGITNPSFLDIAPNRRFLYAIGEVSEVNGKPGGAIAAFAIDQQSGALTHVNTESTVGTGPCHISIDQAGRYALVANYGGGSVAILPIREDGSLGEATDFVQHEGSSVDPTRQKEPHAHSIMVAPNNKHAFAPDLGLDKILVYAIDHDRGKLTAQTPGQVDPGQGPRHLDFHPDGKRAYVINEMGNTITVFDYDADAGTLAATQAISTLPEGYSETSHTADIHIHPNGRFLYGSNRGHDSLVVCAIDPDNGQLAVVEIVPTGGANPRNFGLDPTGAYLLVGNQDTNDIFVFSVDGDTGKLTPTGHKAEVPKPVCHKLIPAF
jgi:6-phosphogluconolactonase